MAFPVIDSSQFGMWREYVGTHILSQSKATFVLTQSLIEKNLGINPANTLIFHREGQEHALDFTLVRCARSSPATTPQDTSPRSGPEVPIQTHAYLVSSKILSRLPFWPDLLKVVEKPHSIAMASLSTPPANDLKLELGFLHGSGIDYPCNAENLARIANLIAAVGVETSVSQHINGWVNEAQALMPARQNPHDYAETWPWVLIAYHFGMDSIFRRACCRLAFLVEWSFLENSNLSYGVPKRIIG